MKQLNLLKPESKSYGGILRNKRKGRGARPISASESMHVVLRSSQAKGEWSFRRKSNTEKIDRIIKKFAKKYHVGISSVANVGNHLHMDIQLSHRRTYKPFIRAITSAIAMAITGVSRWTSKSKTKTKFWDYRPFTRVIRGWRAKLRLRDYIMINQLEGLGNSRVEARFIVASRANTG
jgi:REP element-mobilizing transposase RayT